MKILLGKTQTLLVMLVMSLFLASAAFAGSIKDGRVVIKTAEHDRFQVDGFTLGKAQLFGYISDIKETKKITGIELRNGSGKPSDEQLNSIASIGDTLQLETFVKDGRKLVPLEKK